MLVANGRLRLLLTEDCNLACFYCHNEGQLKGLRQMPDELLNTARILAMDPLVHKVILSGGEPLLHPKILETVEALSPHVQRTSLITNGLLLTRQLSSDLANAGLSKIRLGVDSFRPLKPRPSPGYLERPFSLDDTVGHVQDAGINIELNVVLTHFNKKEIPRFLRYAVDNGLNIKFFEHLEVRPPESGSQINLMQARPHVSEECFMKILTSSLGHLPDFMETDEFAPATKAARVGRTEIRYCRYLCTFRRCASPGTRLDSGGFVYTCMSNRGKDRLFRTPDKDIPEIFARATARECAARESRSLMTNR